MINGPSAAEGIGASGGIINYISRRPTTLGAEFEVQTRYSSQFEDDSDAWKVGLTVAHKQESFDALAAASFVDRGMTYDGNGRAIGLNTSGSVSDSEAMNLFLKGGVNFGANSVQRLEASISRFNIEGKGNYILVDGDRATGVTNTSVRGRPLGAKTEFNDFSQETLSYTHGDLFGGSLAVNAYLADQGMRFVAEDGLDRQDPLIGPLGTIIDQSEIHTKKKGLRTSWDRPDIFTVDGLSANIGVDVIEDTAEQKLALTNRLWVPPMEYTSIAPFVQLSYDIGPLTLAAGIRREDGELQVDDYVTTWARDRRPVSGGALEYTENLPNFGVVWRLPADWSVFASYSKGFSLPNVGIPLRNIQCTNDIPEGTQPDGCPNDAPISVEGILALEPVVVDNTEVGFNWRGDRVSLSGSYYQSDSDFGVSLAANVRGRLQQFIADETSPPIALFHPAHVCANHEGDWYGEHAGKWLYAAARAAHRTSDKTLGASVQRVADYLVSVQEPDGYLGTYANERRFMHRQAPAARTWDGAPALRTWDIWTHSYLILGLLEAHRWFPHDAYLTAARRIGDLCWRTLAEDGVDITSLGNHFGMSATVLLDPAVELYFATRHEKYLQLARLILQQADGRPELALLSQALAGADASGIATGKAYQLCWNLVGLAKLYRATGDAPLLNAVRRLWENIRAHHLSLGGGPWGGVAHRSREVFNHHTAFSPYGYVETCSTLAWIQLNRELLRISGDAQYAEEIERSAYNDLLGAQAPNGEDWCYYSFPNGKRVHTTYWRCCKSSGAMALEELPMAAYGLTGDHGVAINLYCAGEATLHIPAAGAVRIEQRTDYPFAEEVRIRITPQRTARFSVLVRAPSWADGASVHINAAAWDQPAAPGSFVAITREWRPGDEIRLRLPMRPALHWKTSCSVQESRAPNGEPIRQEVMHYDYAAITRGPLVYATGLIDGFKSAETLRLPRATADSHLELTETPPGVRGPAIRLNLGYREPLTFLPWYEAGGRSDGAWRLTWMQIAPESS